MRMNIDNTMSIITTNGENMSDSNNDMRFTVDKSDVNSANYYSAQKHDANIRATEPTMN